MMREELLWCLSWIEEMHMATKLSRERLVALIAKHNGNVMHMAADAGVPRKSIYRRLEAEQLHTTLPAARRAGELREMRDRAVAAIEAGDRRAAWHALIDLHEELGDDVTGEKLVVWLRELVEELMPTVPAPTPKRKRRSRA